MVRTSRSVVIWKCVNRISTILLVVIFGFATVILTMYLVNRPDTSRLQQEEQEIFSSYLLRVPVIAQPFPAKCGRATHYQIATVTDSVWKEPSTFLSLPKRRRQASWIPASVFINFLIRNLGSGEIGAAFESERLQSQLEEQHEATADHWGNLVSARFTKVGFTQDFSNAMFRADVTCGQLNGSEFVYMDRDRKHGNSWYVVRVDPE